MKALNLIGERFGHLTVVDHAESINRHTRWVCKCDCGKIITAYTYNLTKGATKSCGCLTKELKSLSHITHGLKDHPLYTTWTNIKYRCFNPNCEYYHHYGGRGIIICDEWRDNFLVFYEWSLKHGWEKGLEIDRIDNEGPYAPWNCRWTTRCEQNNNKRNNHLIEYNGRSQTMTQWAKELGMNVTTLKSRINQRGWSIEDAFTKPVRKIDK